MSWFSEFNRIWPFPENYLCIDIETSGLKPTDNMLCTFGWTRVAQRQIVNSGLFVLNWFAHPAVNAASLERELEIVASAMEAKGDRFLHTARPCTLADSYPVARCRISWGAVGCP